MTGLGAVLLVATLFTSLYPRVMVSRSELREQPHRRERLFGPLHAGGHDRHRADRAAARHPLPGLDVPRLPAPVEGRAGSLTRARARPAPRTPRPFRPRAPRCRRPDRRGDDPVRPRSGVGARAHRRPSVRRSIAPRRRARARRAYLCVRSARAARVGIRVRGSTRRRDRPFRPSAGTRGAAAQAESSRARRRRGRGGRRCECLRASTRSPRTSAATCRRSCWRASSHLPCSSGWPWSTSPRPSSCSSRCRSCRVHVADRPVHGRADPRALGRAAPPVDALPRRRAWLADVARIQPQQGADRDDRRRQRAVSPLDHEHAACRLPLGLSAGAGGDARRRARRGHRRRAARRRQARVAGRVDGAAARTRAVPPAATARCAVPRECGRTRGCGADTGADRRRRGAGPAHGCSFRRAPGRRPSSSRACRSPIPPGRASCSTSSSCRSGRARRSRSSARAAPARARLRLFCSASRNRPRAGSRSAASISLCATRTPGTARSHGRRSGRRSFAARSRRTSGWATPAPRTIACGKRRGSRARLSSCPGFRRATTHWSATAAGSCRRVRCGGSLWPARSHATCRSSSSTSPRQTSIPKARLSSGWHSSGYAASAPSC